MNRVAARAPEAQPAGQGGETARSPLTADHDLSIPHRDWLPQTTFLLP